MRNYKLTIEYDGTRYSGWQRLSGTENTIQGKLEQVLSKLAGESIEITGSGRTDAGVHAYAQVANFKTSFKASPDQILTYVNTYLPEDIVVIKVKEADPMFHSRYNANTKEYLYRVWNHAIPSALERRFSYHFPEQLDLDRLKEGAALLLGTHDFKAFSVGKSKKSTIRAIMAIEITQHDHMLEFVVKGNGFLHNMVRIIVGTLLEVGSGKRQPAAITQIIEHKERAQAGPTVPPQGLFLLKVNY